MTNLRPTLILLGMAPPDTNLLSIRLATNAELPAAIDLVFHRSAVTQRDRQIAAALEEIERTGPESQIVMVACRGGTLVAAIWVQIQPGAIASLWPPGLVDGESSATAQTLIDLAAAKANSAGASVSAIAAGNRCRCPGTMAAAVRIPALHRFAIPGQSENRVSGKTRRRSASL